MTTSTTLPAQAIELQASDGLMIRGERWGEGGDRRALVIHDTGADLDSVRSIAMGLVAAGFTTVAIDRIGHGASDGEPDAERLSADLRRVVDSVGKAGCGIYLVGIGEAAAGCIEVAASVHPSVVAFLSPRGVERLAPAVLGADPSPTLLLYGARDAAAEAAARDLGSRRPGPALLVGLPAEVQANALIESDLGAQVVNHIVGYLRQIAPRAWNGG